MEATDIRYTHLDVENLPRLTTAEAAIIKLGLPILDKGDVKRYQDEVERDMNRDAAYADKVITLGSGGIMVACAIITTVLALAHNKPWTIAFGAAMVLAFTIALKAVTEWSLYWPNSRCRWQWVNTPFYGSSGFYALRIGVVAVPEKIQDIGSSLCAMGVPCYLEYFQNDPFIYVEDQEADEVYYVAVWNEHGFILPE